MCARVVLNSSSRIVIVAPVLGGPECVLTRSLTHSLTHALCWKAAAEFYRYMYGSTSTQVSAHGRSVRVWSTRLRDTVATSRELWSAYHDTRLRLSRICENAAGGKQVGVARACCSQTGARSIFLAPVAKTGIVE